MRTPDSTFWRTAPLVLGIVVVGSNSFVLSPILTDVAADLATTPVVVARAISAYGVATAVSAFLFSGQIDRLGTRRILMASSALMLLALLGSAASPAWQLLSLCQAAAGMAAGIMLPAIYTTATATAPAGREARVVARVLNGWALSLVAGVPAAALLTEALGWRAAYVALAGLAACATTGFLIVPGTRGDGSAAAPALPIRALRIRGVPRLLGICMCYMSAFYGTYAFLGDHLRAGIGLSAAQAGVVVLAYGAGFGLAGIGGSLVDRLGPARIFPAVLAGVALVYLGLPAATATFAGAIGIALVWGLANHYGLNILVLQLSARCPEARGAILGLHSTVTYLSVFAGPLMMGVLYAREGFAAVALAACGVLLLGAGLAVAPRMRRPAGVESCDATSGKP